MIVQVLRAAALSASICSVALWKRALTKDGAIAAFVCGFCAVFAGLRHTSVLLAFFVSSTLATKVSFAATKQRRPRANDDSRGRRWSQVAGSGGVATILAGFHAAALGAGNDSAPIVFGGSSSSSLHSALFSAYVAAFAFGAADTWASELGVLSSASPRLITAPQRRVPRGTNGGVTCAGTLASALGGLFVGFAACVGGASAWEPLLPTVGLLVGLLGSAVDSVVGATLQRTLADSRTGAVLSDDDDDSTTTTTTHVSGRAVLSNTQVNFVVSLLCAVSAPAVLSMIF